MNNGYQIDFLSFTLPKGHLPLAMKLLHAFDLQPQEKGLYGYLFSYSAVGCRLLFTPGRPDVHIQLSGRGCDNFDCMSLPADAKVTRLDLAFDSFDGAYTTDDVWGCLLQGKTAGTARTIDGYMGFTGKTAGRTVYVGSPKSNTRLRIYDKGAEQGVSLEQRVDYKDWSRFELQLRSDFAHSTYKQLKSSLSDTVFLQTAIFDIFTAILKPFFMVCDDVQTNYKDLTHKGSRSPSAAWSSMFSRFVVERPKMPHRTPTLRNLTKYVMNAAASYKALSLVFDGFEDCFHEKVSDALYSEKHEELLLDFAPYYIHGLEEQIYIGDLPF